MTRKQEYDGMFPYTDIELTITAMGINGHPVCKNDLGDIVHGVWPGVQTLPMTVGARYKARQYILTGSCVILTEKL
jgi:hypothetical protein